MILPRSLGHKVTNLISRGDWCSLRCNPGLIKHLDLYEREANVFLLLQKDWEGVNADHFFLSKTYQEELKERSVDDYKKFWILR